MRLVITFTVISLFLALSGCTVLGFATDIALISVIDENNSPQDSNSTNQRELLFTTQGLKHDMAIAKNIIGGLSVPTNSLDSTVQDDQQDKQAKSITCKNIKKGKQQCYPPEYYADMYIDDTDSQ